MIRTLIAAALLATSPVQAGALITSHGLSSFGDLKYDKDFAHFDYVNPDAPKGGQLATMGTTAQNSFDSLNAYILKGVPANGFTYDSSEPSLVFDSLMVRAGDEPDAVYGLVAHSAEFPADRSYVIFHLREDARFADGTPLRARDVVTSFDLIKDKGHPGYRLQLADVEGAEALGELTVKYTFTGPDTRDLALRVAQLPIFSAAYYAEHEFDQTTVEPPLGSGPYRVADVNLGRSITFERRDDYWAADLNVNKGRYNFDRIRFDYFRDRSVAFEAFKANAYDLREEFTSKTWATEYDFPGVKQGKVNLLTLDDSRPSGMQGFFINMRRAKFADRRVRRALDLAFDFEWTNRVLFYGLYERTDSVFENAPLASETGPPDGAVQALLEEVADLLPADIREEVLTGRYIPPVTDGTGRDRTNLKRAADLLTQAGFPIKDGVRMTPSGEPFELEFLMFAPSFKRVFAPYIERLKRLGITARMRIIDIAQFEARREQFDFDLITARYALQNTPGPEFKPLFHSKFAAVEGSTNLAGIAEPAVDALVQKVLNATSRDELVSATRALDRVLMSLNFWVPHWFKGVHNVAAYDKFSWPGQKPLYERGILDTWWAKTDGEGAAE